MPPWDSLPPHGDLRQALPLAKLKQPSPVFGVQELEAEADFWPHLPLVPQDQAPRREPLGTPDSCTFSLCSEQMPNFLLAWQHFGMSLTKGLSTDDSWTSEVISSWGFSFGRNFPKPYKAPRNQHQLVTFKNIKQRHIQKNCKTNLTTTENPERQFGWIQKCLPEGKVTLFSFPLWENVFIQYDIPDDILHWLFLSNLKGVQTDFKICSLISAQVSFRN